MERVSVIICTYNPEPAIFERCLQALSIALQKTAVNEIIIVDNNSTKKFHQLDFVLKFLEQNSNARIVTELKQGLTPARLLGIKEAGGSLLVFIDDDNFIAADFFSKGIAVAQNNPNIGAWSGQVLLEFERQPEPWTKKYWGLLVYREFNNDSWSNLPHLEATMPCGAGLFIRKNVAEFYLNLHETGKRNIQLDRTGKSLFSGGDNDMAACACDIGLGVGLFHEIVVMHFIPSFRVEKEYLLKLAGGIAASTVVLKSYRSVGTAPLSFKNRVANGLRMALKPKTDRSFFKAVLQGEEAGRALAARNNK